MHEDVRVSASQFQKAFGLMSDNALRSPVTITKQGRDHLVVLSAREYQRLKRRDRIVYGAGELPDDLLEAVEKAEMDARHNHLDYLFKESE